MFSVKVYNRQQTVLIDTIKPNELLSDFSFKKTLNSSAGQLTLMLAKSLSFDLYKLGYVVNIVEYNDNNKQGIQHFKGIITKVNKVQTDSQTTLNLTLLGVATLLTKYQGTYHFTGQTIGQATRDIIDSFNSQYGNLISYTSTSIEEGDILPSGGYLHGTYQSQLKALAGRMNFIYFIDGYGVVHMKHEDNVGKHYLINKKNVEKIVYNQDLEGVVNKVKVIGKHQECSGGSEPVCWWVYKSGSYEDITSINNYGLKQAKDITIYTNSKEFCEDYAQKYVEKRLFPRNQCTLTVNRDYNIESINPGDKITVKNIDVEIKDLTVTNISYTTDKAVLYLGEYRSFGQLVVEE